MTFDNAYFNIGYLDSLSYGDTFVHRLDARVKIIASVLFIVCVVSFPKYELSGLMPFFLFPLFLTVSGDIPISAILKKILVISPFVLLIGIFNPFLDQEVMFRVAGIGISGGILSFCSIMLKFVLSISTALLLVATTSFLGICEALSRLKIPDIFVTQLLFIYRYLFVLLEEAFKMVRARDARSYGNKGYGMRAFTNILSVLLIRTLQRAERIYGAMIARGFEGKIMRARTQTINMTDISFLFVSGAACILLRYVNLPVLLGHLVTRKFG